MTRCGLCFLARAVISFLLTITAGLMDGGPDLPVFDGEPCTSVRATVETCPRDPFRRGGPAGPVSGRAAAALSMDSKLWHVYPFVP